MTDNFNNSASGYVTEPFEGFSQTFTDVETLRTSEVNVVAKGKRYGRWWLLKGLRQEVAGEIGYRQRLCKELEVLMQLQHPNIVSAVGIEAVGELGECIVMEFVDGMTLKKWLQSATTQRQRRKVAHKLIEAVEYVHAKGIVHRDLKPENILITVNGESVKLADFGLADADSYAILKQPAGTPRYMSPEQMQTAVADVRNDIYSLGVLFGEMKLGYSHIVKRCLLPLEKRYQNIRDLTDAIRKREKRQMRLAVVSISVFILLLTGLIGRQTLKQHNFTLQTAEQQAEQKELKATIALLTDSLDRISALYQQMRDEQNEQLMKRQQIENAINKGKAEIDKVFKETELKQHFDTLSNPAYLNNELFTETFQRANKTCETYIKRIAINYTKSELMEINYLLTDYQGKCGALFTKRFNQLQVEYDRKIMQGD